MTFAIVFVPIKFAHYCCHSWEECFSGAVWRLPWSLRPFGGHHGLGEGSVFLGRSERFPLLSTCRVGFLRVTERKSQEKGRMSLLGSLVRYLCCCSTDRGEKAGPRLRDPVGASIRNLKTIFITQSHLTSKRNKINYFRVPQTAMSGSGQKDTRCTD